MNTRIEAIRILLSCLYLLLQGIVILDKGFNPGNRAKNCLNHTLKMSEDLRAFALEFSHKSDLGD